MKKALALVLCIALAFSVLVPFALAADWSDGPTLALTATNPDENNGIVVTLELKGKDTDLIGAMTLNLVYDETKVEPDTAKGNFKKGKNTYGLDIPEFMQDNDAYPQKIANTAQVKQVAGEDKTVYTFLVSAAADVEPEIGVGASSKINYYFKVKEGAEGPAVFTLATDSAKNFQVTDYSGDNSLVAPAHGTLSAQSNIPKSPVTAILQDIEGEFTYTGSAIEPAVVVKVGENTLTAGVDYQVAYANNVNAGENTATVTITPDGGNVFNDSSVLSKTFSIARANATITVDSLSKKFGEADPTLTASVTGTKGEDTLVYTLSRAAGEDAGAYPISVTVNEEDNPNYTVLVTDNNPTFTIEQIAYPGSKVTEYAIVPVDGVTDKVVAVSLPAEFKNATVNGDPIVGGIVTAASYADGSITLSTIDEANENDSGFVVLKIASTNYTETDYELIVTAKKVEAEWTAEPTAQNIVYGQNNAAAVSSLGTATVTDPEGNAVAATIEVADAETVQSAGDRSITVNVVTAEYGTVLSKVLPFTVTPAPATVTWTDTSFEYTGAAFKPTATVSGGVNGETLSVVVSGEQTNTGSYTAANGNPATATLSVEGGNADPNNYEMDKPTCDFEITGKKITFVVTLTPDTFDENGAVQKPTVDVSAKEDVVLTADDYVVVIPESIEAGTYTVTVNAKEGSPFFGSDEVTAQYKICGKPSFKTLKLVDGHTALTARYEFDANGYEITKYEVSVWLIEKNEDETETKTELEGSPFDAGTSANYTVSKLVVGNTYEVVVKATNEKGEAVSTAERVTLTKAPVVSGPTDPTYAINIVSAENGKVIASMTSATAGAEVKLTVKPAEGYELAKLTVTASDGTEIVLSGSDNEYSFVMPKSTVKVTASFEALPVEPGIVFEDVHENDYFFDSVYWAVDNEITMGKTETLFAPLDNATRAEVVTFLWRQAGQPEPLNTESAFEDVAEDAYYFKAVLWAYEMGIVLGKSETSFAPTDLITRGQFVTMLYRMSKAEAVEAENPFIDVEADAYYAEAVLWAAQNGITKGMTEDTFAPNAACNRAQVVEFLYRFFK